MKKVIFAALVVLLALLAVTCDSAIIPGKLSSGPNQAASNEPGFVTVTIGTSVPSARARALNKTQAQPAVEGTNGYYEVVFYRDEDGVTVRAAADRTKFDTSWTLKIPSAVYTKANSGANKAVLFAGKDDKTLLAIGLLSASIDLLTTSPGNLIFQLFPITKNQIENTGASGFRTSDGSWNPVTGGKIVDGVTDPPAFEILTDQPTVNALFEFSMPKDGAFIDTAGPKVTFVTITPAAATNSQTLTKTGALPTGAAVFSFAFSTTGKSEGYMKVYIEVPVYAVNKLSHPTYGDQDYVRWFIKGGLNNTAIDMGLPASDGGAVLLELVEDFRDGTIGGTGGATWPGP